MKHELKISQRYYDAVMNDYKSFEVRKDDRGYQVGDTVVLAEIKDMNPQAEERPRIFAHIKYILRAEDFPEGLKEGYCIIGLTNVHPIWEDEERIRRQNESDRIPLTNPAPGTII